MTTVVAEAARPRTLRSAAWLLLAGQLLYIAMTQFHAGGDANDHHAIFATYAQNAIWSAVHLGQFAAMALLVAGLVALFTAPGQQARVVARIGLAMAGVTLTLYAALQAVDGVALKQAVDAWSAASVLEEPARFASAEAVRWLEWGMRSYEDFAFGLTLLLVAATVFGSSLPRPIAWLAGLSGLAYLGQGWIAGTEGFTAAQSALIVAGWVFSLAWMAWLAAVAARPGSEGRVAVPGMARGAVVVDA